MVAKMVVYLVEKMVGMKADSMAAWTVASRVESWAENWAVSKADYLAVSKAALRA